MGQLTLSDKLFIDTDMLNMDPVPERDTKGAPVNQEDGNRVSSMAMAPASVVASNAVENSDPPVNVGYSESPGESIPLPPVKVAPPEGVPEHETFTEGMEAPLSGN